MTEAQTTLAQDFSNALFGLQRLAVTAAKNPDVVRLLTPAPPHDDARFNPLQVMTDWDDGITGYFNTVNDMGDTLRASMPLPAPNATDHMVFARAGHYQALRAMGGMTLAAHTMDRVLDPFFDVYWGIRHKTAWFDPETRLEASGKRAAHAFFKASRKRLYVGTPLAMLLDDLTGDVTGTRAAMEDFAFTLQPHPEKPRAPSA